MFLGIRVLLLLLLYTTVNAQDFNLGFEDWIDSSMTSDSTSFPDSMSWHKIENPSIGALDRWGSSGGGIMRTTDSYAGNYALVLHQWYGWVPGTLLLGGNGTAYSKFEEVRIKLPGKLYGVSGYYKYFPDTDSIGDTYLFINTYQMIEGGDSLQRVTTDTFKFLPVDHYTKFELPITYTEGGTQIDSISIKFVAQGTPNWENNINPYSYYLYLDNLELHYGPLSIDENALLKKKLEIFPNPASEKINLHYESGVTIQSIELSDVLGKVIQRFKANEKVLDVSGLPKGVYTLQFIVDKVKVSKKVVIQ